ncbi:MAG TPA: PEP-CTERM sorting domain-containing protein [Burkholderiales bacterium]|nr:PEP-CTERM sorting domain-containing protein [Burkholderiales bacterium]
MAPIPEPQAYALLLAGLGLLAFTARRRKQS